MGPPFNKERQGIRGVRQVTDFGRLFIWLGIGPAMGAGIFVKRAGAWYWVLCTGVPLGQRRHIGTSVFCGLVQYYLCIPSAKGPLANSRPCGPAERLF